MAEGDNKDLEHKLRGLIPSGWFMRNALGLGVVLGGLSDCLAWLYSLMMTVGNQARLLTSQGWFIDLFAWDFLGPYFLRRVGETDASFLPRVQAELLRERVTRKGIYQALLNLTGRAPVIIEPFNPGDCGAIGVGTLAFAGAEFIPSTATALNVGATGGIGGGAHFGNPPIATGRSFAGAGMIGSTDLPYQIFITAYRPPNKGLPDVQGIGYAGFGSIEVIAESEIESSIDDAEIYAAVAETVAGGVTAWVAIEN